MIKCIVGKNCRLNIFTHCLVQGQSVANQQFVHTKFKTYQESSEINHRHNYETKEQFEYSVKKSDENCNVSVTLSLPVSLMGLSGGEAKSEGAKVCSRYSASHSLSVQSEYVFLPSIGGQASGHTRFFLKCKRNVKK